MKTKTRTSARLPRPGEGAPTKCTAETAARIFSAVSKGVPFGHAAKLAGICYTSFCNWRNKDAAFREQLDAAISLGVEKRLRMIQDAADAGDWRAAEAWLRLVLPMEYGRQRLELSGVDGAPLSAGVRLYLPAKNGAVIECEPEAPALAEGSADGNGN